MRLQDSVVDLLPEDDKAAALLYKHNSYDLVNQSLDQIALWIANTLQRAGYGAFPVPASMRTDDELICGIFSQKLAAHLAGLGWIGKSCLLVPGSWSKGQVGDCAYRCAIETNWLPDGAAVWKMHCLR